MSSGYNERPTRRNWSVDEMLRREIAPSSLKVPDSMAGIPEDDLVYRGSTEVKKWGGVGYKPEPMQTVRKNMVHTIGMEADELPTARTALTWVEGELNSIERLLKDVEYAIDNGQLTADSEHPTLATHMESMMVKVGLHKTRLASLARQLGKSSM